MSGRKVHAVRINLHTQTDWSVIIWLDAVAPKLCVKLMNPRRTWMTARAGDPVDLKIDRETCRQYIYTVELYRVFPANENGRQVRSA